MASAEFKLNGFNAFENWIDNSSDSLQASLLNEVNGLAELIAGDARTLAPVGMPIEGTGGTLRDSIEGFVHTSKNDIVGGAKTNLEYAAYVEFGTGPTGTKEGGHPLDSELGIVRKQEKWKCNIPGVGVRHISGQVAQPFMYPAMKQNEEPVMERFKSALEEVLNVK